jgi:hypothetical protein
MAIDYEKLAADQERREKLLPEHRARAILNNHLPHIEAYGWRRLRKFNGREIHGSGAAFENQEKHMTAIASVAVEDDGKTWIHYSIANHQGRMPTWEELVEAKEYFAGTESVAYQILAPRSQWVNIHQHALHFFVCVEGPVTPDFSSGTGSI